jgi:FixJ family two-component response regulator
MNPDKPTVFVVDDDPSFLTSVARLLRASRFTVKAFPSAADFLAQLTSDTAGCVVADLQMPGMNGSELQEALARMPNPLPVVFLTGHGEIPDSVCAMRRGAEDFLSKRAPREALLDAVRRALTRDARERAGRERIHGLRARFDKLSEREREVLQHVLGGQLNKQIAADLGIHERTVKLHRTAVTRKLGVPSVAELSQLVQEAGLFTGNRLTFPKVQ